MRRRLSQMNLHWYNMTKTLTKTWELISWLYIRYWLRKREQSNNYPLTPHIYQLYHAPPNNQKGIIYNWEDKINNPYVSIISRAAKQRKANRYKDNFNTIYIHLYINHIMRQTMERKKDIYHTYDNFSLRCIWS